MLDLISAEVASGIPPSRIAIAGFSQGGAVALFTGLQYSHTLAGVLCLSGYLAAEERFILAPEAVNTPVAHFHGSDDQTISVAGMSLRSARREFCSGMDCDWSFVLGWTATRVLFWDGLRWEFCSGMDCDGSFVLGWTATGVLFWDGLWRVFLRGDGLYSCVALIGRFCPDDPNGGSTVNTRVGILYGSGTRLRACMHDLFQPLTPSNARPAL
eukprot:scaffold19369_cov84-Isochrysis_galbana.AAC.1